MKAFLAACATAIVLAIGFNLFLSAFQKPSETRFTELQTVRFSH